MKDVVGLSTKFLCETLGIKLEDAKSLDKGLYGSSIPVFKGKEEYHFYLFFKRGTLNLFASAFFGSKSVVDADLDDLCKEIANQIVGKAKNILNEQSAKANYKLGTPEFLGEVSTFHIKLDEKFIYKIKNRTFAVGYKKV